MIGMMVVLEHHSFFQEKLQALFHYKIKDIVSCTHACKLRLSHIGAISGHGELQAKSRESAYDAKQNKNENKKINRRGGAIRAIHAIYAIRAKIGEAIGGAGPKRYRR